MAVRNLNVELSGASGLENSEFFGKSDPYAIISIGKTERTSKVAHDQATAPSWNEKFTLPVLETDTELVIRILNENSLAKDDELGRVVIPLSEIHGSHDSPSTFALQHKGKPHGEIKLNVSFEGEDSHESKGLIAKIQDLFVGEKNEVHDEEKKKHQDEEGKEHHEEVLKELHEEKEHHDEDKGLKEKVEEKIEELKEKVEEKADTEKEEGEEKAGKKKKGKKNKKDKSKKSGDEESSSSSDSESDKEEEN